MPFWNSLEQNSCFLGHPLKKHFFFENVHFFFLIWLIGSSGVFLSPSKKFQKWLKKIEIYIFVIFQIFKKKKKFQIFPKLPISHLWWILSTFSLSKFFSKMHGNIIFQRLKNVCWTFFLQVLDWSWDFELNVFLLRAPRCSQSSESMGSHCRPQACSGSPLIQRFRPVRWGASINTSANHQTELIFIIPIWRDIIIIILS